MGDWGETGYSKDTHALVKFPDGDDRGVVAVPAPPGGAKGFLLEVKSIGELRIPGEFPTKVLKFELDTEPFGNGEQRLTVKPGVFYEALLVKGTSGLLSTSLPAQPRKPSYSSPLFFF